MLPSVLLPCSEEFQEHLLSVSWQPSFQWTRTREWRWRSFRRDGKGRQRGSEEQKNRGFVGKWGTWRAIPRQKRLKNDKWGYVVIIGEHPFDLINFSFAQDWNIFRVSAKTDTRKRHQQEGLYLWHEPVLDENSANPYSWDKLCKTVPILLSFEVEFR